MIVEQNFFLNINVSLPVSNGQIVPYSEYTSSMESAFYREATETKEIHKSKSTNSTKIIFLEVKFICIRFILIYIFRVFFSMWYKSCHCYRPNFIGVRKLENSWKNQLLRDPIPHWTLITSDENSAQSPLWYGPRK